MAAIPPGPPLQTHALPAQPTPLQGEQRNPPRPWWMTLDSWELIVALLAAIFGAYAAWKINAISERQADLAKAAFNPVLTFETPKDSTHDATIQFPRQILIYNHGPSLRSFQGEIKSMAIVRHRAVGSFRDHAVYRVPIMWWYKSWPERRPTIVQGLVAVLDSCDGARSLKLYPYQPDSNDVVPELRITNVLHVFRSRYVDAINEEHDEYYLISRKDFYPLQKMDGEALFREMIARENAYGVINLYTPEGWGEVVSQDTLVAVVARAKSIPDRLHLDHEIEPEHRWPFLKL